MSAQADGKHVSHALAVERVQIYPNVILKAFKRRHWFSAWSETAQCNIQVIIVGKEVGNRLLACRYAVIWLVLDEVVGRICLEPQIFNNSIDMRRLGCVSQFNTLRVNDKQRKQ